MRFIGSDFTNAPTNVALQQGQLLDVPNIAAQSAQSIRQNINQVQQINSQAANTDAEVAGRPLVRSTPQSTDIFGTLINTGLQVYDTVQKANAEAKKLADEKLAKELTLEGVSLTANSSDIIYKTSEGVAGYQRKGEDLLTRAKNVLSKDDLLKLGLQVTEPVVKFNNTFIENFNKEANKVKDTQVSIVSQQLSFSVITEAAKMANESNPQKLQEMANGIISNFYKVVGEDGRLESSQKMQVIDLALKSMEPYIKKGGEEAARVYATMQQTARLGEEINKVNQIPNLTESQRLDLYSYYAELNRLGKDAYSNTLNPNKQLEIDAKRAANLKSLVDSASTQEKETFGALTLTTELENSYFTKYYQSTPAQLESLKRVSKQYGGVLDGVALNIERAQKLQDENKTLVGEKFTINTLIGNFNVTTADKILGFIERANTVIPGLSLGLDANLIKYMKEQLKLGVAPEELAQQKEVVTARTFVLKTLKDRYDFVDNQIRDNNKFTSDKIIKDIKVVDANIATSTNVLQSMKKSRQKNTNSGLVSNFNMPPLAVVQVGDVKVPLPFLPNAPIQLGDGYLSRAGKHMGLDIPAPSGTPIIAPMGGKILSAGVYGDYGNTVDLQMPDGKILRFAHLNKLNVKEGQDVPPGFNLGTVGTTGKSSGPHLHVEVRSDIYGGVTEDPIPYFTSLPTNRGVNARAGINAPVNRPPNSIPLSNAYILNNVVYNSDGTTKPASGYTAKNPIRNMYLPSDKSYYQSSPDKNYGYAVLEKDDAFRRELHNVSKRLDIPTQWLADVMAKETDGTFSPSIPNYAGSGATGLIQFMPDTAIGLGTTTNLLGAMTRTEQLKYVEKYLKERLDVSPIKTPEQLVMSIWASPAAQKSFYTNPASFRDLSDVSTNLVKYLDSLGSHAGRKYQTTFSPVVNTVHTKYVAGCPTCQGLTKAFTAFLPHEAP